MGGFRTFEDAFADQVGDRHRHSIFGRPVRAGPVGTGRNRESVASSDDSLVGPVLTRVTNRRIDYLAELFIRLGFSGEAARHRAAMAYSTYLGTGQLWRTARGALPADASAWDSYVDEIWHVLIAPGS